jgi:16S rRNA (guanine966-N2)-methyltransferase
MRIVSGQFKGRVIAAPKSNDTRPTADRARETLFNILAHADWAPRLSGARVMDVFAGSGALGFEAISRGAASCVFVETAFPAQKAIMANAQTLELEAVTRLIRKSAVQISPNTAAAFDVIFIDPPYYKGLIKPTVLRLIEKGYVGAETAIIAETAHDEALDADALTCTLEGEKEVGAAKFWFLRLA